MSDLGPGVKFVVGLDIDNWETRAPDPNDRWDIGDKHGSLSSVYARPLREWELKETRSYNYLGRESYSPEWTAAIGEFVVVVYALYTSGCTFGRTGMEGAIIGVWNQTNLNEAIEAQRKAEGKDSEFPEYRPWEGYFEELEGISMQIVQVQY
jgi:hypothetical protein